MLRYPQSDYTLPDKVIALWAWPPDLIDRMTNRWARLVFIGPSLFLMIILMLIFSVPFLLTALAEPFVVAWKGR